MTRLGALVEFSGFGTGHGSISFNKLVTFIALQAFVFAVVTRREPPWPLLSFGVIVIGAGFGLKGYLAGVKQNTTVAQINATATVQTALTGDLADVARAVVGRRDAPAGVEATE